MITPTDVRAATAKDEAWFRALSDLLASTPVSFKSTLAAIGDTLLAYSADVRAESIDMAIGAGAVEFLKHFEPERLPAPPAHHHRGRRKNMDPNTKALFLGLISAINLLRGAANGNGLSPAQDAEIEASIQAIQAQATTDEAAITAEASTESTDVSALAARVTTLEAQPTAQADTALADRVTAVEAATTPAQGGTIIQAVANLGSDLTTAETKIADHDSRIAALEAWRASDDTDAAALDGQIATGTTASVAAGTVSGATASVAPPVA